MKQISYLLILFILLSIPCFAQEKDFDESVLTDNGKQAYQTLLRVQLFAIEGIGYSGKTSEGEVAFDMLLEDKEAISAFKSLLNKATIEGALYGLFGLKMTKCDCYQEEFIKLKKSRVSNNNSEKLSTAEGCSYYEAEKGSNKEFYLDYIESKNYFGQRAALKTRLKEQRKLKAQNPN